MRPSSKPEFEFIVQGSQPYEVFLQYTRGRWLSTCNCPYEFDCKHGHAALCYLVTTAAPASPAPKARAKAIPKAKPKAAEFTRTPFALEVEAKLGRPVERAEMRLLELLESARTSAPSGSVAESLISPLWGVRATYSWQHFTVWPKEPATPWEAWLYLFHFIQTRKLTPPAFLAGITTAEEIEQLLAPWRWQQEVDVWRAKLAAACDASSKVAVAAIDLRVVFHPAEGRLERRSGDGPWQEVKKDTYHDWRQRLHAPSELLGEAATLFDAFKLNDLLQPRLPYADPRCARALSALFRNRLLAEKLVTPEGAPLHRAESPLAWHLHPAPTERDSYRLAATFADGAPFRRPVLHHRFRAGAPLHRPRAPSPAQPRLLLGSPSFRQRRPRPGSGIPRRRRPALPGRPSAPPAARRPRRPSSAAARL